MTFGQRLLSVTLCIALIIGVVFAGTFIEPTYVLDQEEDETQLDLAETAFFAKDTLEMWYTDDALTDYLTNMAVAYYEDTGIQVVPRLKSAVEYLETAYDSSVYDNIEGVKPPDLYILGTDKLEKAYLEGLACEIKDYNKHVASDFYSKAGVDAVTYHGKKVALPFYFETSAMLYNKTYMDESGRAFPQTLNDLQDFADAYEAPEAIESVFKWDPSDIFYNYYIAGNYLVVGGDTGDDKSLIDVNNADAVACLDAFKSLNEFFYVDRKITNYESIMEDFMQGKMVFTVATSDCVATLEKAKQDGSFAFEYGVTMLPNISADYKTRSLSQTESVVINGFSTKRDLAEGFATYITFDNADKLYEQSGKMAVKKGLVYPLPQMEAFYNEYDASIGVPKLLGAGNYWVSLEIGFSKALDGEDSQEILDELQAQLISQNQ